MKRRRQRRLSLLLAGVWVALLLSGCGEDESVHTGADAQDAQTAASAEADAETTDTAETDGDVPETAGADGSQLEETEGTEEANAAETGTDAGEAGEAEAAGKEDRNAEQTAQSGPWNKDTREQMEIDEETRRELTEELLAEENMDTSVMEERRATTGCSFEIPEGFAESEEVANLYVRKRYPIDASTIYYAVMEEDIALQLLTREAFAEQMKADLLEAYNEEVEVTVDSFEHVEISGYPAFRILCHYTVGGVEITQLQYAINADRSYMITYSQTSDYDYMELYEASAATIEVK